MSDIVAEIKAEMEVIFHDLSAIEDVSVSTVEARVSAAAASWTQRLSEAVLSEAASSEAVSPVRVPCPSCEGDSHRYRCRARTFTTVCGVVRVSRGSYQCQCGHIHVPWDSKQGLKGQYTEKVAAAMMRLAAQLNYRAAALELKHHGIHVSHTTLHQKVLAWSEGEEATTYVDEEPLDTGSRWYISARMQYQTFTEKGYQIGSGVIESACKHVVAERCKQAGMRWSKPGINAILFWRCLLKNDAWDTYWDTQEKQAA